MLPFIPSMEPGSADNQSRFAANKTFRLEEVQLSNKPIHQLRTSLNILHRYSRRPLQHGDLQSRQPWRH